MRSLFVTLAALSAATVSSQLVVPLHRGSAIRPLQQRLFPFGREQVSIMDPAGPGPAIPPTGSSPVEPPPGPGGDVLLSDIMGRDKSVNLFAGFLRDIESAARRIDDPSQKTMILAPLNSAIEKLPRKPWEDPKDYGALGPNAYEGDDGQERAQRNLRRFVEAHMLPVFPWVRGEKVRAIGDDQEIWWETKHGVKVIQPAGIEIVSCISTAANGQVLIIKNVRNYA
ncbi:hypothetical protein B0H63DRAFT_458554 [Podospora didyma]|uniref:FAS1 domain-containing protein n=1 Tax=Podospora didyma TaxID=330526 RepID=A0AAE0P507_9PEZI|nr:hypothetical protein B0H63DRAFT_458554 [Podospora didyma]